MNYCLGMMSTTVTVSLRGQNVVLTFDGREVTFEPTQAGMLALLITHVSGSAKAVVKKAMLNEQLGDYLNESCRGLQPVSVDRPGGRYAHRLADALMWATTQRARSGGLRGVPGVALPEWARIS